MGALPQVLSFLNKLRKFCDGFTLALLGAVALSFLCPPREAAADAAALASKLVVAALFFLHGAKLSRQALWGGLTAVRVHLAILAATFVMFPLLGLAAAPLAEKALGPEMTLGILFLAALPSTVQSSIAFTSIARGSVAVAVCAASASSILGVALTPLLVHLTVHVPAASAGLGAVRELALQLVLPFAAGQALRPAVKGLLARHGGVLGFTDRLSVVFIVFVSFSRANVEGLWQGVSPAQLLPLALFCLAILAAALLLTHLGGVILGFSPEDRTAVLFCGSKKSLMAGVPMAGVLFSPAMAGVAILPLMFFHQLQLVACAQIARMLGARAARREAGRGREGGDAQAGRAGREGGSSHEGPEGTEGPEGPEETGGPEGTGGTEGTGETEGTGGTGGTEGNGGTEGTGGTEAQGDKPGAAEKDG
ncbi:MAG: bile acid:sodium symporter [Deltaproteobacteria bacterium]|jgi:sodium/bile acid cotransporter 7|nr:bile acid:sodium symporter [Deltaproteobacteria bacterium]